MLEPISRSFATEARAEAPRFYSVAAAAEIFGMSPVTLYRAIRAGQFPAVRIRGRLIVPAKAIESMTEAALTVQAGGDSTIVDAAGWVVDSERTDQANRFPGSPEGGVA